MQNEVRDDFDRTHKQEIERIKRMINGQDCTREPKWYAPGKPNAWYALGVLAHQYKIEYVKTETGQTKNRKFTATVTARRGNTTRIGASEGPTLLIAEILGFRNAIGALIPQNSKLAQQFDASQAERYA